MDKANLMMRRAALLGIIGIAAFWLFVIFIKVLDANTNAWIVFSPALASGICGAVSVNIAFRAWRLGADVHGRVAEIMIIILSGLLAFYVIFTIMWGYVTLMFCGIYTCELPWVADVFDFLIGWMKN